MKRNKAKQDRLYPIPRMTPRSKDLPATQGMLYLVRSEVRSDIRELRSELKSDIKQLDSKILLVDSKVSKLDSKIESVLQAVHHLTGEVARIGILVEEQNSKNNLVLEGHTGLAQRQDRLEARMDGLERTVRSIARHRT